VKSSLICVEFPAQKWPNVKKRSLEIRFARRSDARLPYPTLTGWYQVCITRQDDPVLRLPTNRGRENHLLVPSVPPLRLTSTRGRTDNSEHRAWQALGIIILIPARDATQRRGAATTRQEAGLGTRGVTKTTTCTRTSKHQDSDPQAHKQPTRRHNRCKPDGQKHGHSAYHPHPCQAQPADTIASYDPCNNAKGAAPTKPDNSTARAQAPTTACTIPFLRGRTRASPLSPQT